MKIFVLLPRIPYPLEKGDKLRAYNQIKQLARNNEIVLCALNDNKKVDEQQAFQALQPYCSSINFIKINKLQIGFGLVRAFFKGLPLQCGYFYNRKAARKVDALIAKHRPDFLFGQLVRVAEYIRHKDLPKAIDYQDVFSYGMKRRRDIASWITRPVFNMEYQRLCRYEAKVFDEFEVKTIISRCGNDSKMVLTGDPDQIDNPYLDAAGNGLAYTVDRLKGEAVFGHIMLQKSERSGLAALAAGKL